MDLKIKEKVERKCTIPIKEIEELIRAQLLNTGKLTASDELYFTWRDEKGNELIDSLGFVRIEWEIENGRHEKEPWATENQS